MGLTWLDFSNFFHVYGSFDAYTQSEETSHVMQFAPLSLWGSLDRRPSSIIEGELWKIQINIEIKRNSLKQRQYVKENAIYGNTCTVKSILCLC